MDTTAKVWDVELGVETVSLAGHTAEVIALQFLAAGDNSQQQNSSGSLLLTGSFDHTASLWDVRDGRRVAHLVGHTAEVASAIASFDGRLVATASMDKTVRVSSISFNSPLRGCAAADF